tara:strand:- start:1223 stop:1660 length:438 start_codon:yes stop_codon:yes gene_type:complete
MNLKELKGMIAQEYSRYLNEQDEVPVDVDVDAGDVDMGADMGDEIGEDPEETLRSIYDMLSDYFEGGEEGGDEEIPMDDVEGGEAPEADLEEWNGKNDKKAVTTKDPSGYAGYKKASTTRGRAGFGDKNLAEMKRMQKLANIIKG